MKLLVLTPTLGRSPFFPAMLKSLAGIKASVRHLIICPEAAISSLRKIAPTAEFVNEKKGGLYAALNEGLAAAGAEWDAFTWINDDDGLIPAGVDGLVEKLKHEPGLSAVYGKVNLIDRQDRRLVTIPVAHAGADFGPLLAAGRVPLAQPGTLIRRSAAEKMGGFDSGFGAAGDIDYFQRMLAAGLTFGFVDQAVAAFRVHEGQISKQKERVSEESARVFQAARENPAWAADADGAVRRFRWNNAGVYLERILRHGPVTMEKLYARR